MIVKPAEENEPAPSFVIGDCRDADDRSSPAAKSMFGDFVYGHLLNTAVQEQTTFDNLCVTDWELSRYFERG